MITLVTTVRHSLSGVILGVAVLFLGIVAAVGVAFAVNGDVLLPGVFTAWFTSENGLPAMNFEPNFIGMLFVIIAVAVLHTVSALQVGKRISARHRRVSA